MSNPSSESPDSGKSDRLSDGEEEMLSLSRRSLLKLAAAGAAALGFTGSKNARARSEIDDLELPNELEIDRIFIPENEKFALMTNNSEAKVLSFDPSSGSFDAQGKAMLNMSTTQFGESFRLPAQKTKMKTLEKFEVLPNKSKVLADLSGKKVVTSIWMATHGRARLGRDAMFRIYTDGSTEPDLEMDTGTLWANHLSGKGEPLLGSTRHMSVGSNWSDRRKTHMLMNFPIPCSEGIRIELQNTNSTNPGYIYSQVTYRDGVTAPFRLKGAGTSYLYRDKISSFDSSYKMLDVSGTPGWLIWTSSCVDAWTNDS
ncbi:MAG: twin-arginine translocation signal domain-containing protein, partial [Candidatus Bipolaricaulota bacterium]